MDQTRKFNEVSISYNNCVADLEKARLMFQDQLWELNDCVWERLEEMFDGGDKVSPRHKWHKLIDKSSGKDGPWLRFNTSIQVRLSIKPPNFATFRKAAFLYFECEFDKDLGRFMFQCRLENQNKVNELIDEEIIKVIKTKPPEDFPLFCSVKTDRAILFKVEIDEYLFNNLNHYIDSGIDICNEAVNNLYPENLYGPEDSVEMSDEVEGVGGE